MLIFSVPMMSIIYLLSFPRARMESAEVGGQMFLPASHAVPSTFSMERPRKAMRKRRLMFITASSLEKNSRILVSAIGRSIDRGSKNVFVADSLEELVAQTGIKPEGLRQNVEEYNQACEAGVDELFGKNPRYLRPVKQPKFYAIKMYSGAHGTLGGIKINYKTEVLTKNHDVIPGLYAVGVDANDLYGDSYGFILPGHTMGFAIDSGRMAGENAAEYIKSTAK
jgi:succinate dehydrogenase/fumarate reductase flavoprotein subunit